MKKIIHPCNVKVNGRVRKYPVFIQIEYTKEGRLSISGVVGPFNSGNCAGGWGQIDMEFKAPVNNGSSYYEYRVQAYNEFMQSIEYAPGWDTEKFQTLLDVWDKWHLNDMNSACIHQKELGWTYDNHHGVWEEKPVKTPKFLIDEYATGEVEMQTVYNEYKGHACPVCGYSIGSAWLFEEVPQEVIDFLFNLPDSDKTPAWV